MIGLRNAPHSEKFRQRHIITESTCHPGRPPQQPRRRGQHSWNKRKDVLFSKKSSSGPSKNSALHWGFPGQFHSARQPEARKARAANVLEVLVFDELHDDVLLGLDLQHLQRQAQERRRLNVPAVDAPHVFELHGFVHHQLGCEKDGPSARAPRRNPPALPARPPYLSGRSTPPSSIWTRRCGCGWSSPPGTAGWCRGCCAHPSPSGSPWPPRHRSPPHPPRRPSASGYGRFRFRAKTSLPAAASGLQA